MRHTSLPSICLIVLLISTSTGVRAESVPPYQLAGIKALLYYDEKGSFSENIIDNPKFEGLWNTIIGAYPAGSASNATLVLVEINGKPGSYVPARKVEFLAVEHGKKTKTKLKRTAPIGVLSQKEGRYFVAFWLYETGCAPISLSATLVGQTPASTLQKNIPFECGE